MLFLVDVYAKYMNWIQSILFDETHKMLRTRNGSKIPETVLWLFPRKYPIASAGSEDWSHLNAGCDAGSIALSGNLNGYELKHFVAVVFNLF